MRDTQPVGDRVVADLRVDHPVITHLQYQATVLLAEVPVVTELAAMVPPAEDLRAEVIPEVDQAAVDRVATALADIYLPTNTVRATRATKFLAIPLAVAINRCSAGRPLLQTALGLRSKALRQQKFN